MRVLVVNAGSSSLKLRLLAPDDTLEMAHDLPVARGRADPQALAEALAGHPAPDAIGHRIVHGGERYRGPVRLDDDVLDDLRALSALAPLHQLPALEAAAIVDRDLPGTPTVACFDTAFHGTLPAATATYALPRAWRERWPLRRYGFHGLSHAYAARRAGELLGAPVEGLRLVSCHLGAGASVCAIDRGRSVDTTMGFTPLKGLVMATRSGSVDPGLLLWLLEKERLPAVTVAHALEYESGLFGLAGTGDMREILRRVDQGEAEAALALDVYVHRLRAGIASMAIAMDGLDAVLFTGGIGEHASALRARTATGLETLGVAIDPQRNARADTDADVSAGGTAVRTLVIHSREDLQIAREVREVLDRPARRVATAGGAVTGR
jgi:acetate kinase